jgi:hypothetical protein
MNTGPQIPPTPGKQERKCMSGLAKCATGCGIAVLVLIVIAAVLTVAGMRIAKKQLDNLTADYRKIGFSETVRGQKLSLKSDITEPTILLGQLVQVYGSCSTNLAVIAQVAEIHGTVSGRLHFKGQILRIMSTARIEGGAEIIAQSFANDGVIEGEIIRKNHAAAQ